MPSLLKTLEDTWFQKPVFIFSFFKIIESILSWQSIYLNIFGLQVSVIIPLLILW